MDLSHQERAILSQYGIKHFSCSPLLKVVFDMDGTLTEGHIDFADMRQRTREVTIMSTGLHACMGGKHDNAISMEGRMAGSQ